MKDDAATVAHYRLKPNLNKGYYIIHFFLCRIYMKIAIDIFSKVVQVSKKILAKSNFGFKSKIIYIYEYFIVKT